MGQSETLTWSLEDIREADGVANEALMQALGELLRPVYVPIGNGTHAGFLATATQVDAVRERARALEAAYRLEAR